MTVATTDYSYNYLTTAAVDNISTVTVTTAVTVHGQNHLARSGQNHLARHSERGKKTRRTKDEVGKQHQGIDRPGVRQVPKGSGEQGKMEKTGCKIICGAPTTLAVKGLMMMMIMMMTMASYVYD